MTCPYVRAMTIQSTITGFVSRLREVCDDMGLPAHGRQTALANHLKVTQGAAKKWLNGDGYPTMDKIVAICEWANVNVIWLVMGAGAKRNDLVDTKVLLLGEALDAMPTSDRQEVLNFLAFKFSSQHAIAGERIARYMTMIDAFKKDRQSLD